MKGVFRNFDVKSLIAGAGLMAAAVLMPASASAYTLQGGTVGLSIDAESGTSFSPVPGSVTIGEGVEYSIQLYDIDASNGHSNFSGNLAIDFGTDSMTFTYANNVAVGYANHLPADVLNFTGLGWSDSLDAISLLSIISGNTLPISTSLTQPGFNFSLDLGNLQYNDGDFYGTATILFGPQCAAVPEPTTYALLGGMIGVVAVAARRKKAKLA